MSKNDICDRPCAHLRTSLQIISFLNQAIASNVSKNTPVVDQLKSSNNGTKESFLPIIPSIKIANPTNKIPKISLRHPHQAPFSYILEWPTIVL
jgi:hypothetical protein